MASDVVVGDIVEHLQTMHDIHVGYTQKWAEASVNARVTRAAIAEIRSLRSLVAEMAEPVEWMARIVEVCGTDPRFADMGSQPALASQNLRALVARARAATKGDA